MRRIIPEWRAILIRLRFVFHVVRRCNACLHGFGRFLPLVLASVGQGNAYDRGIPLPRLGASKATELQMPRCCQRPGSIEFGNRNVDDGPQPLSKLNCKSCDLIQRATSDQLRFTGRDRPILLKNSFSRTARKIPGSQRRRSFSHAGDHAIFRCARPSAF